MTFSDLGLSQALLTSIEKEGYTQATPIQALVVPLVLKGGDLLGEAQTGSGKTAAFALPILQMLSENPPQEEGVARALILAPTRELALQVAASFKTYGQFLKPKLKVVPLIGGENIESQLNGLQNGADILVATTGRLIDLMDNHHLSLSEIKILVIDEADKMLNLGFADELNYILDDIPKTSQNLLFSATFPEKVTDLTKAILKNPTHVKVENEIPTVESIHQRVIEVNREKRGALLRHLVQTGNWDQVLVFVASQTASHNMANKLVRDGIKAGSFHGGLTQKERVEALKDFKNKKLRVLISTDLAARGIDIQKLPYVINYDLPRSPEDYIHRIGRTGRAGESGVAISFIGHEDQKHFLLIEKRAKINLEREQIEGFQLTGEPPVEIKGKGPIKGKRKSKKDKLREKNQKK